MNRFIYDRCCWQYYGKKRERLPSVQGKAECADVSVWEIKDVRLAKRY